ncbi:MAG: hypothetical protein U0324_32275 [Polyangiales bacterium]
MYPLKRAGRVPEHLAPPVARAGPLPADPVLRPREVVVADHRARRHHAPVPLHAPAPLDVGRAERAPEHGDDHPVVRGHVGQLDLAAAVRLGDRLRVVALDEAHPKPSRCEEPAEEVEVGLVVLDHVLVGSRSAAICDRSTAPAS